MSQNQVFALVPNPVNERLLPGKAQDFATSAQMVRAIMMASALVEYPYGCVLTRLKQ